MNLPGHLIKSPMQLLNTEGTYFKSVMFYKSNPDMNMFS